jgi:molecular chaperone GrpE
MDKELNKDKNEDMPINEELNENENVFEEGQDAEEVTSETNEEKVEKKSEEELLREEVAQLKDKNLRLIAEYDNYRKRAAKDQRSARENGVINTMLPFLQVYEHMKMAEKSIDNGDPIEAISAGVKMLINEFKAAISDLSVVEINAIGEDFDPNIHSAVEHKCSDEVEEGKVISQWTPGYKIGERIIKPARVVVSSGPKKDEPETEEPQSEQE